MSEDNNVHSTELLPHPCGDVQGRPRTMYKADFPPIYFEYVLFRQDSFEFNRVHIAPDSFHLSYCSQTVKDSLMGEIPGMDDEVNSSQGVSMESGITSIVLACVSEIMPSFICLLSTAQLFFYILPCFHPTPVLNVL